jgi:hypothetical protein
MTAAGSFKMSMNTYQTTLLHIPEDSNLHNHCCPNPTPHARSPSRPCPKLSTDVGLAESSVPTTSLIHEVKEISLCIDIQDEWQIRLIHVLNLNLNCGLSN